MKPLTIWSLWDMLRFYAADFNAAAMYLSKAHTVLHSAELLGLPDDGLGAEAVKVALEECAPHIKKLPLSPVMAQLFEDTRKAEESGKDSETKVLLLQTLKGINIELAAHCFLMIKENRKEFYEQHKPPFGKHVQDAFPEAGLDIASASRCYALDEWTACVFHLMRVLEHGLIWLVKDIQLPSDAIEKRNWYNLLNEIDKKIAEYRNLPRQQRNAYRLAELSAVVVQFRNFKDAWRNHTNHAHQHYDENAAEPIWRTVKDFMGHLVTLASSPSSPQLQP